MTLDPAALDELLRDRSAATARSWTTLVDTYLGDSPDQLAGIADGRWRPATLATLGRARTRSSPAAPSFGATALAAIARELEEQARAGDAGDAGRGSIDASAEFARVAAALEAARLRGWRP